MKKLLFVLSFTALLCSQSLKPGEAKGLFLSTGIGPAFPVGDFSNSHSVGVGGNFTFSYTDNKVLPVFLYVNIGYQHYPGSQSFYQKTDYSSISTNMILINPGARYYFPPIFENVVILMPVLEGGATYSYVETLNQFKLGSGRLNFYDELSKFGFHIGAGFSMFLLDAMLNYCYLKNYQSINFNLKIRIPIFMKM